MIISALEKCVALAITKERIIVTLPQSAIVKLDNIYGAPPFKH